MRFIRDIISEKLSVRPAGMPLPAEIRQDSPPAPAATSLRRDPTPDDAMRRAFGRSDPGTLQGAKADDQVNIFALADEAEDFEASGFQAAPDLGQDNDSGDAFEAETWPENDDFDAAPAALMPELTPASQDWRDLAPAAASQYDEPGADPFVRSALAEAAARFVPQAAPSALRAPQRPAVAPVAAPVAASVAPPAPLGRLEEMPFVDVRAAMTEAADLAEPAAADLQVPPPAAGRGSARNGRVKTRLLGFNPEGMAPQSPFEKAESRASDPFPVAWLVVVSGPGRGASFPLHDGVAKVGRGEDQAVSLNFGDSAISRENHVAIAYDNEQNAFFIGQSGKANIVRLNNKPLLSTEEMRSGDQIRVGETTLRFVALCSEGFSWAQSA